jgi:uncharacterized protein YmfQ (DUF2313 family)
MSVLDRILKLANQLYPKGRVFKMQLDSEFRKLNEALGLSEERAYNDALAILNSILPDNPSFTEDDATDWERRLGLITNLSVSFDDRKAAILRKMNHPGTIPARQHFLYLEGQLQAAGFNVFVFENKFPDGGGGIETRDALTVSGGVGLGTVQLGDGQLGDNQLGGGFTNVIVNYIDEEIDFLFNVGSNLRKTFFIGADPVGDFANVDINRKDEFRQLILKIKPAQMVGYLFINYI